MKTFELTPVNNRKSFYNKCKVIEYDKKADLLSYDTIVATYNKESKTMQINGYYSPTTANHINAFLHYYGFKTCSKKELENYNN